MAGETVLAVDDRDDNLNFLREYVLEPNGYKMLAANNGKEAMDVIASNKQVALVISDLVMPRMGGLELLESLREKGLDTPAILMTFHGSEETAVRAFRLGARDYIIKPFAIEEMLNAIDNALTESRLRQERDQLMQTVLKVNQQLESRVQELRFLYGIGRSVSSLRNPKQILNRIVEAGVYLTEADEGSLMLIDPASGELYLRAARGMGEKNAKNFRLRINDSISGQVVQTGRPIMIGGMNQDDSFKVSTGYFVKAILNVPLKVGDRVIGVLAVNNKDTFKAFSERHLNLLMALADYASIAIQNARLYAQLTSDVKQAKQSSHELEKMVAERTEELKNANQQLVKTEKLAAFGYMAQGIARAIDTPINSILDNAHQIGNKIERTSDNIHLLETLRQEALHCQYVVQGLLNFAGQKEYRLQKANLNDIIEKAWARYVNEKSGNGGIEFIRGFDPYLPLASIDSGQMEQALFYIIRTACHSMLGEGTLQITSRAVGNRLQIIINDTGVGIPKKDMVHIFDPFYQTSNQSYGLDLSIAHTVIQRHKGSIELESSPGQGTTFTIHLLADNAN